MWMMKIVVAIGSGHFCELMALMVVLRRRYLRVRDGSEVRIKTGIRG